MVTYIRFIIIIIMIKLLYNNYKNNSYNNKHTYTQLNDVKCT